MAVLAAASFLAPMAYAMPESAELGWPNAPAHLVASTAAYAFENYANGWRTDLPSITGAVTPDKCLIITGSVNPAKFSAPAIPLDVDGNPVFYGNGNIMHVFGQQASQQINICEYKNGLHYRIGSVKYGNYPTALVQWKDPITGIYSPYLLNPPFTFSIGPHSPGLFLHVDKLGSSPVAINNGEGYYAMANSAVVLTRASAAIYEEMFPLDDRLLVRLTKFASPSGTLIVALPPWVAKEGKEYALINGVRHDLKPHSLPVAGPEANPGIFSLPIFAGGDPLVFAVPYTVDLSGGTSLSDVALEIEVFPTILDKHLYRIWDGNCYRYRYDGAPPDPEMTTIYKAATGKPACVSLDTAKALEDAGWGVIRPEDGSPLHVLTTATRFNGAYMEPYAPDEPIIGYGGSP